MEQETVCELRRTNIFLRLVLFLFTLIILGAAVALFFVIFHSQTAVQTTGIFLLIFAAMSYGSPGQQPSKCCADSSGPSGRMARKLKNHRNQAAER